MVCLSSVFGGGVAKVSKELTVMALALLSFKPSSDEGGTGGGDGGSEDPDMAMRGFPSVRCDGGLEGNRIRLGLLSFDCLPTSSIQRFATIY